ncbi:MAG: CerR family C-terminal domain-containing protein [Parvibaculaceae bacterium]
MGRGQNTKQRLLEAARGLFAERGYHNTTVRDIALRAQTNLASINYYFHSKDDLYRAVIRDAFQPSVRVNGAGDRNILPTGGSAEEQLRRLVRQLIQASGEGNATAEHRRLMAWEMLAPTGVIETVDDWEVKTHLDAAQAVVRVFMPQDASSDKVLTTALWLIGQCLVFRRLAQRTDQPARDICASSIAADDEGLIDLIVTRAMSGLRA